MNTGLLCLGLILRFFKLPADIDQIRHDYGKTDGPLQAGDIDIIYCYGFGFPRHRGGPMFYAETVGLATVLARVNEYRARFGSYWQPAPLLERLVSEGRGFYND